MCRKIRDLAIAALSLLLAACSTGWDELVVGNQYEGLITFGVGGTQIPLPEGKWRLVGSGLDRAEIGGVLIRTKQGRVSQLIDFYVPSEPRQLQQLNKWPSSYNFCNRKNIIFMGKSESMNRQWNTGPGKDRQDCWGINHWPVTFHGNIAAHLQALRDYVDKNELELPITMIAAQYRRSGHGKYMSLNYYFNPELEGFAPPERADWRTSDWHRDRYFLDPKKKAYIEKMKKWAAEWHTEVDRGFKGLLKRGSS